MILLITESDRPDPLYCPILERDIAEIECYEHLCGCADSEVGRSYHKYSFEQMKEICKSCKYSNIG